MNTGARGDGDGTADRRPVSHPSSFAACPPRGVTSTGRAISERGRTRFASQSISIEGHNHCCCPLTCNPSVQAAPFVPRWVAFGTGCDSDPGFARYHLAQPGPCT
ncbi:hypothetical protein Aduo_013110 [Ancylostoma duodenale]